jgi:hypothetical protein
MLPWQLVEAHEPGPVYFPTPSVAVARSCDNVVDGKMQPSRKAAPSSRKIPKDFASSFVFMSCLARVLYRKI